MPVMKIVKGRKGKKVKSPKQLEGRLKGSESRKPQNYTQIIVKNPQTRGGGRPSKRATVDLAKAKKCAEVGMTDKQIAIALGIAEDTIAEYKKNWPEFSESLKKKMGADGYVERSLWERAIGYRYTETKRETDAEGNVKITTTEKFTPPDPTAMIFWLKNRQPEKWRDKKEIAGQMTFAELIASQHDK